MRAGRALAGALGVVAASGMASAQQPAGQARAATSSAASASAADAKARAQDLLSEGVRLVAEAEFSAALDRFRAAYALFPSPKLLLNIGTTLRHLGRQAEAALVYEQYLAHPDADPQRAVEVRRALAEIEQAVGNITIQVNVEGARFHVDGKLLPGAAEKLTVRADPGEHTVAAERDGFVPAMRTVEVAAGQPITVSLELVSRQASSAVGQGQDGTTQRVAGGAVGGVGVVGLVLGGVFGGLALSNDQGGGHCNATTRLCDAEGMQTVEAARTEATVSTIALVVGGLSAATGVVLLALAPGGDEEPTDAPAATVSVSGSQASVALHW